MGKIPGLFRLDQNLNDLFKIYTASLCFYPPIVPHDPPILIFMHDNPLSFLSF